jgi:glyoxylase-like metal-dependent hydrolase (beta-lactamase superfamily II)
MAKLTLQRVKGNSYFLSGVLSIGVYIHEGIATIIDSGGDESCAKDIHKAIEEAGYQIGAIINTHCHPDHCGGNAFLQKKIPGLKTYATHDEQLFIENIDLAPRCFCSLACPFEGLQNKYIAPQRTSTITNPIVPYEDQTVLINGALFQMVTLPGHTPGMIGIITPDNILYSGDALFGENTITKHPVLFYTDIKKTFESFNKIKNITVDGYVLVHGGLVYDGTTIVDRHIDQIRKIKDTIFDFIQQAPLSIDALTQKVMQNYTIMNSMIAFTLTQTVVKAYVSYLESEKAVELVIRDGLLVVMSKS